MQTFPPVHDLNMLQYIHMVLVIFLFETKISLISDNHKMNAYACVVCQHVLDI